MKKLTVGLLVLTVLTGGAFAQLSVGFNAGFTGDMFGLSSDFYDQNKGGLTDELTGVFYPADLNGDGTIDPNEGVTNTVEYEPNGSTIGFDFGLNATYDMGFFFLRADFRRETLVAGGENTYEESGAAFSGGNVLREQTTSGAITSIPVYLGVNIPVMKGKVFAGIGYGYYMADASLTLDVSGSYIDAQDAQLAALGGSFDRQGVLEYSTSGTGVEYIMGYQSKITDNLSLSFNYSAGGGVVYGESEFDTWQIAPIAGAFPGLKTTDYTLAQGFDELSSQFLYTEIGDGTKTKTMFPLKTAGAKIMMGIQYHF